MQYKKAAVLGFPVRHSKSPRLHGWWLKQYRIAGTYEAIEVPPEQLAQALDSLVQQGFAGCNLTIPHKEQALSLMDSLSAEARMIGAVNTVVIKDGKKHGSNTDAYGFIQNLKQQVNLATLAPKAVVLGAGGASRAVVYALLQEGFSEIVLCNRTEARAQELAAHFADNRLRVEPWEARAKTVRDTGLLVNTTSLGLEGNPPLEIDLSRLSKQAVVTDIVYNPLVTPLLQQAAAQGLRTIDGLGMLLHQAAPGFEAWFGRRPEVTQELRQAVLGEIA